MRWKQSNGSGLVALVEVRRNGIVKVVQDLTRSREAGGFTVVRVDGPAGSPSDLVGGDQEYFWEPSNLEPTSSRSRLGLRRAQNARLPNVKNADLGVPVELGVDARGAARYAYIMGDVGDRDAPNGGFGGDRVAGNAVLLAHKAVGGDDVVVDGFLRDPSDPRRPLELFPVERPRRFTSVDYPDGHPRSVVPTGAVMVGGKLVVAYQQMDWHDQAPGRWKGEGSFLQSYGLGAGATVESAVTASPPVAVGNPDFQQIQLAVHAGDDGEAVYILGSADSRFNAGPHLAKAKPEALMDPSKWRYYEGVGASSGQVWTKPGRGPRPGQAHTIANVPNVGEGGFRIVRGHVVMVYTDGGHGVVMRTAPLGDLEAFGPLQPLVTGDPGQAVGPVGRHYNQPGNYGGFIQDVDEERRTITVVISRWNPYGVYLLTVHYA